MRQLWVYSTFNNRGMTARFTEYKNYVLDQLYIVIQFFTVKNKRRICNMEETLSKLYRNFIVTHES